MECIQPPDHLELGYSVKAEDVPIDIYCCEPDTDEAKRTVDVRRKKIPSELQLQMMGKKQGQEINSSSSSKSLLGKINAPPPTPNSEQLANPNLIIPILKKISADNNELVKKYSVALNQACSEAANEIDNQIIPESTPECAPFDVILDFMAAVIKDKFENAIQLAHTILEYEPFNTTVQEYLPILTELMELENEDSASSCTSESEEGSGSDEESCSSTSDTDSSDEDDESSDEEEEETSEKKRKSNAKNKLLETDEEGEDDEEESCSSISTVESDEYMSEYGEEYEIKCGDEKVLSPKRKESIPVEKEQDGEEIGEN